MNKRTEVLTVVVATVLLLTARAVALRFEMPANVNPLLTDHDIPYYATIVANPEPDLTLARDPTFGGQAPLFWHASPAYFFTMRLVYVAAGHELGKTLELFQLLLLAIYFPSMTFFLRRTGATLPTALAVAAVSLVSSWFLVTGTRWGIFTPPVPLVMTTAVAPLIALAVLRSKRHPVVAGTLVALPMLLINPASGVAMVELALIVAFCSTFVWHLPWRTFALFAATIAVWLIAAQLKLRSAGGALSFSDADEMIRTCQDNMVFPFRGASMHGIGIVLAAHVILTVAVALWYWRANSRRAVPLILLCAIQASYAAFFLRAGWLVLLPLSNTIRRRRSELSMWLLLGASIAIGPLQQAVLLFLWQRTHWAALPPLIVEGGRFLHFAYLVLYVLVARTIEDIKSTVNDPLLRLAVVAFITCGVYFNLDVPPLSVRVGILWISVVSALWLTEEWWRPWFSAEGADRKRAVTALVFGGGVGVAMMLALYALHITTWRIPFAAGACVALVLFAMGEAKNDFRGFLAASALAIVVGGGWMLLLLNEPVGQNGLGFTLKLPRAERNRRQSYAQCDPRVLTPDFKVMTEFIREHLPPSAVFHSMTFDRSFRAYAQRAMLPVSDEWLMFGVPVERLRLEASELWNARDSLPESRALARQYGADYLIRCGGDDLVRPVFSRGSYAIESLK
ncbi:MAG TPA: hypothetical protein VK648_09840 [Gemmatimonadaceae bacterium]|nr:hypothetical protein [Gemmatimonadaceae bacterium]